MSFDYFKTVRSNVIGGLIQIYIFLLSPAFSPYEWITDTRSGKQYAVVENITSTLNHDINQQKCIDIDGHLPEPKTIQDNLFLDSLGSNTFLLGIRYTEGHFIYESDGSVLERSAFSGVSWGYWLDDPRGRFPWEGHGFCVSMLRNRGIGNRGHKTWNWANNVCASDDNLQANPKSLVCESE